MNSLLQTSVYFGVLISIAAYETGEFLKKKFKHPLLNPLLISIIITMLFLKLFKVDYNTYNQGAKYLSYLLTPATVALAVPLYRQIQLLKDNFKSIMAGIAAGTAASLGLMYILSLIFKLSESEYATLLPKSITTAIGMGVSEELGGIVTITVALIVLTGISGNIMGEFVCKIFRITNPIAKGVALGTSAHAIGTAKAMEMGEIEGAISSLSIAVAGILTVVLAPLFMKLPL